MMPPDGGTETRTAQAYVLVAVSALLVVSLGSALQLRWMAGGLAVTELFLILLPAVLFVRRKGLRVPDALGWRPVSPGVALLALAVGATGAGAAQGVQQLLRPLLGAEPAVAGMTPDSLPRLALLLFVGALLPGLCEESLFRGAVLGVLSRRGPYRAVLITGVIFGAYHLNPWVVVPASMLGLVWGALVVRTGSTVPAILAHFANNATGLVAAFAYRGRPDSDAYPAVLLLAAAFLVVLPLFWLGSRSAAPRPSPLAAVDAGLRRPGRWIAGLVAGSVAALIVAVVASMGVMLDVRPVSDDALAPEISRGDRVVMLKSGFKDLRLKPGDVVSYGRAEAWRLARVTRVAGDTVWIDDGRSHRPLPLSAVAGKLIYTVRAGGGRDARPADPTIR